MRAFQRTEIIKHKCQICGCRNKLYTIIPCVKAPDGKLGFVSTCCNCGHEIYRHNFGDDDKMDLDKLQKIFPETLSYCAMLHTCKRRNTCPYRKYDLVKFYFNHFKIRSLLMQGKKSPSSCEPKIKKLIPTKLLVNTKRAEKFR